MLAAAIARAAGRAAAIAWAAAAAAMTVWAAAPAAAQVLLTQDEALRLAFPSPATVERRTAYLAESDLTTARALAGRGVDVEGTVVTYYVATRDGAPVGAAYFDAHRVRTRPEVLMVVVTPDERIERIEVLKFSEPPEYRAPEGWVDQLEGRALSDQLSLKGEIRNMTGATLTSRAVTDAARRVLALHRVIRPFGTPDSTATASAGTASRDAVALRSGPRDAATLGAAPSDAALSAAPRDAAAPTVPATPGSRP